MITSISLLDKLASLITHPNLPLQFSFKQTYEAQLHLLYLSTTSTLQFSFKKAHEAQLHHSLISLTISHGLFFEMGGSVKHFYRKIGIQLFIYLFIYF